MMFKHYYPLIPISRPLRLAFATGCVAAGAYYLYRNSSRSSEDSENEAAPAEAAPAEDAPEAEPMLEISNELVSINHNLSGSILFGLFESYLIVRPHLTSSRLSLLDDEAGPSGVGGAKKRKIDYSSTTSECTTDLSGNKLEGSDPPVDLDESSFGDVVLVLKDQNARAQDDSSDTPDDTYNDVAKEWFSDLQSDSEEEEQYEIEYVDFYDRY